MITNRRERTDGHSHLSTRTRMVGFIFIAEIGTVHEVAWLFIGTRIILAVAQAIEQREKKYTGVGEGKVESRFKRNLVLSIDLLDD